MVKKLTCGALAAMCAAPSATARPGSDLTLNVAEVMAASSAAGIPDSLENSKGFRARDGMYVVGYVVGTSVDGDFDGNTTGGSTQYPNLTILQEDIDPGPGFGVGLGVRWSDCAFEFHYNYTVHDTEFVALSPSDANFQTLNFDFKYYFLTDGMLQPHLLLGAVYGILTEEQGSFDSGTATFGEANFHGAGINVGAGLTFYLTDRLAITGSAGYRFMWILNVEGIGAPRLDAINQFDGSGFFAWAGVSYSF